MAEASGVINLGEQLDITIVSELKQKLSSALADEQPVVLDGSSLERVDTAGVQILMAFSRAAAEGPGWGWHGGEVPDKVDSAARYLGVVEEVRGDSV
ncbi:hypothetical protein HH1059_23010 [Halorhodospira halochloris]|uniref:STAS domain-containing protein n=1 Tax=Halorhodospira halochloris TaxID=1052 RepID=A0A0X8X6D6_HALHR|nr:STAS domain-containing protein [Halorhodospira halochloris]MCG5547450.1 STAS domain-containing protein [Halorhodospira halochloris]BAU56371.2 hypothetical protein HH1059_23010 [Halorhodospira halochloris]